MEKIETIEDVAKICKKYGIIPESIRRRTRNGKPFFEIRVDTSQEKYAMKVFSKLPVDVKGVESEYAKYMLKSKA